MVLLAEPLPEVAVTDGVGQARMFESASKCLSYPDITNRLTMVAATGDLSAATWAAQVLAAQEKPSGMVVDRLIELIASTSDRSRGNPGDAGAGRAGELPGPVVDRLVELIASTSSRSGAIGAAQVAAQGELPGPAVDRLCQIASKGRSAA